MVYLLIYKKLLCELTLHIYYLYVCSHDEFLLNWVGELTPNGFSVCSVPAILS